jgi:hypothetical protein
VAPGNKLPVNASKLQLPALPVGHGRCVSSCETWQPVSASFGADRVYRANRVCFRHTAIHPGLDPGEPILASVSTQPQWLGGKAGVPEQGDGEELAAYAVALQLSAATSGRWNKRGTKQQITPAYSGATSFGGGQARNSFVFIVVGGDDVSTRQHVTNKTPLQTERRKTSDEVQA